MVNKNIMKKEEKVLDNKDKFYYLIFHISYCIMLLHLLFFIIPSLADFISLVPLLLIPLSFKTDKLKWRFFTFLGMIIPYGFLNGLLAVHIGFDFSPLFFPIMVLFVIVVNHYILNYFREKANDSIKKIAIIVIWFIILLLIVLIAIRINKMLTDNYNSNLESEISCKATYTLTPVSEIENLCNQIKIGGYNKDRWIQLKSYCLDLVKKITENKYYFDYYDYPKNKFGFRNPLKYLQLCTNIKYANQGIISFKINQHSSLSSLFDNSSDNPFPEVKDPGLCDAYNNTDPNLIIKMYGFPNSNAGTVEWLISNCYQHIASTDVSSCEKSQFPHQCYENIAIEKKDPTICDKIKINYALNVDEDYIEICKASATNLISYCNNIINKDKKIGCYANIATVSRDKSICDGLSDSQDIQTCKQEANV